jgi:hypothetical protein
MQSAAPPAAPGSKAFTPAQQLFGTIPTKKKIQATAVCFHSLRSLVNLFKQDALLVFAKEGNIEGAKQAIAMLSETGSKGKALNAKHHVRCSLHQPPWIC